MRADCFESLIDAIYAAGTEPQRWTAALRQLADSLSGLGAVLTVTRVGGMNFSFHANSGFDPLGFSCSPSSSFGAQLGLCAAAGPGCSARACASCGQRIDVGGVAKVVLAKSERQIACCSLLNTTTATGFAPQELDALRRLAPHILRAIELNRRLAQERAERETLAGALDRLAIGIFMLKADGSLTCVNAAGEQLLLQRNGLERSGCRLLATDPAVNRELSGLIQQVTTVGSSAFIAVPRRNGLRPLAVRISPLHRSTSDASDAPARIALFVTNPDVMPHGAAECIMAAYGLTAAEKRLVDALTAGESLKDAADALGVTEVTLRNRLARVMTKTGTNRQAELVAVIMAGRVQAI